MKLSLVGLRKYQKLFGAFGDKGKQVYESFLIDSKNSRLLFFAENFIGQVSLPIEKFPDEKDDLFFCSKATFLTLVKTYPEIILENRKFVSSDGEYELASFEDDVSVPNFSLDLADKFSIPVELSKRIHDAIDFVEASPGSLNGVFLYKGHIVGTDRNLLYDFLFDPSEPASIISLPLLIMKIYDSLPSSSEVVFSQNDRAIRLNYMNELIVQTGRSVDLSCPDITDPSFKSLFAHENSFDVEFSVFSDLISFMKSFVQDAPSKRILFSFSQDNLLTLEAVDFSKAKRSITIQCSSPVYFTGKKFWISAESIEKILKKCSSVSLLKIRVDFDSPTIDFLVDSSLHIVCTKILEE